MKILISLLFSCFLLVGCHEGLFHWITPEPGEVVVLPTVTPTPELPPLPTIVPEVLPEEEVGEVLPDPTPEPPCEIIKGNISSSGEKIFHVPGGAYYDQVKINEEAGEAFFCSEDAAKAAGFRKALR